MKPMKEIYILWKFFQQKLSTNLQRKNFDYQKFLKNFSNILNFHWQMKNLDE